MRRPKSPAQAERRRWYIKKRSKRGITDVVYSLPTTKSATFVSVRDDDPFNDALARCRAKKPFEARAYDDDFSSRVAAAKSRA